MMVTSYKPYCISDREWLNYIHPVGFQRAVKNECDRPMCSDLEIFT